MNKVLISTILHPTSIGSILQALALQKAFLNLTNTVKTVSFQTDFNFSDYILLKGKKKTKWLQLFYNIIHLFSLRRKYSETIAFIDNGISQVRLNNYEQISSSNLCADIYVAGSDQIWRSTLGRKDYFLSYAPKDKKRISYAASMGVNEIPPGKTEYFSSHLKNFDAISVRETEMVSSLQGLVDKNINCHIDPTFLLDVNEWRNYSKICKIKQPYVLVYALFWDRTYNTQLNKLRQETGLKIVSIQNSLRPIYSNKVLLDVDPGQFLWLIDHAEAVITSSFHGLALSIIFGKRVFPVINPKAPSRIKCLLETLNFNPPKSLDELMTHDFDYPSVNKRIAEERKRSFDYLKSFIDD